MRRVSVLPYSADHVLILKRELKLMRAVVREVDLYEKHRSSFADVRAALDAFNKGARKP